MASGELVGLTELAGLEAGVPGLRTGVAVVFERSAPADEEGVVLVTAAEGVTLEVAPGVPPGVAEAVASAGRSFISSRRRSLFVVPLCA